ncbi:PH domain-containing protein [Alkalicoccus urumqiensis]|nr:PH domain-containing protein [Alkalicoccus urumqiensis]
MNNWQRQHPAAILVSFFQGLRQLIVSFVVIFIFGSTSGGMRLLYTAGIMLVILTGSLIVSAVSWYRFEFRLIEEELQVKQGLFVRKKRYIRRNRVQSIHINAPVPQRFFGLVEVSIETAGGGDEPEFTLSALPVEKAEQIRGELLYGSEKEEIFAGEISSGMDQALSEPVEEKPRRTWELGFRRLLLAAVTSSGVGIAATFAAALLSQLPQFLPDWLLGIALGWIVQSSLVYIGLFIVTVLLLAWIFTILSTVIKYGQFQVTEQNGELFISKGLIEKKQLTIQQHRINAVRIVQNVLRQPLGYCAVYIESAGGGTKDEDFSTILLPMCKKSQVPELLETMAPDFAFTPEFHPLPRTAVRRYMIKPLIPITAGAAAASYFLPFGWLIWILLVPAALLGYLQYKSAGLALSDRHVFLRWRTLSLEEAFLPRPRIQSVAFTQNPLQRNAGLFSLHMSVLTTVTGKTFSLKHTGDDQKEDVMSWYSYQNGSPNASDIDRAHAETVE